jgi:hypothetical protein
MQFSGILPPVTFERTDVSEESIASTIKVTRRILSSGMLRRVALVRTDVSEELSASFIRVTRID